MSIITSQAKSRPHVWARRDKKFFPNSRYVCKLCGAILYTTDDGDPDPMFGADCAELAALKEKLGK